MNQLSFFKLIKEIIKKSFTLSGREPKESIITYLIFLALVELCLSIIYQFLAIKIGYQFIFSFLPLIPLPALFIRRIHDHNKNLGFTLLPFCLFLMILPFLNFKAFEPNIQNEKLITGGIIIEILTVLFLIQFFLFFILLFSKGDKNENLYGKPLAYLPIKVKKSYFFLFCFVFICFFFFILSQNKKESIQTVNLNILTPSNSQTNTINLSKKNFSIKKQPIFHKIEQISPLKTKEILPLQKDQNLQVDSIQNEIKVNDLLNFLFSLSIQTLKDENEVSYSENTPPEIILIKAQNGNITFILKDTALLNLIKQQSIDCQKEVCHFKSNKYLKTINKRY